MKTTTRFGTRVMLAMATLLFARPSFASDRIKNFIADLHSEVGEVRAGAALALGEAGDPRAVGPLQAVLNDEYVDVRKAAAWSLGELADKTSAKPLSDVLQHDKAPVVRATVAASLGKIRVITTGPALRGALADSDANVRSQAIEALAMVAGSGAASDAIALLDDGSWSVRCSALNALGDVKSTTAVDRIALVLAHDDNEFVRAGAAHALGRIGDKSALAALSKAVHDDNSDRVRGEAAAALLAMGVKDDGDYKTAGTPDMPHGTVGPKDTAIEL